MMLNILLLSTLAAAGQSTDRASPLTRMVDCARGEAVQRAASSDTAEAVADAAAVACQPFLDAILPPRITMPGDAERTRREQATLDALRVSLRERLRDLALATVRAERGRN